jgi:HAD superfamily hydrolase (TIGR01484 family)
MAALICAAHLTFLLNPLTAAGAAAFVNVGRLVGNNAGSSTVSTALRRQPSLLHLGLSGSSGSGGSPHSHRVSLSDVDCIDEEATLPLPSSLTPPSSASFYSEDDLRNVLDAHCQIQQQAAQMDASTGAFTAEDSLSSIRGLHELVEQTVLGIQLDAKEPALVARSHAEGSLGDNAEEQPSSFFTLNNNMTIDDLRQRVSKLRAIASDVDGTLLTANHRLHPVTWSAIIRAVAVAQRNRERQNQRGVRQQPPAWESSSRIQYFFPATGKSKSGAFQSFNDPDVERLLSSEPGVFCQGLYCVGVNNTVIYQNQLSARHVEAMEAFAIQHNITLLAYYSVAEELYTLERTADPQIVHDVHHVWNEPAPIIIPTFVEPPAGDHAKGLSRFNKILVMHHDEAFIRNVIRPGIEQMVTTQLRDNPPSITSAISTMVECLPANCGKHVGVQAVCDQLGVDPATELLAIGDAENDIEMLQMASIGIAMGNAPDSVKAAADVVLSITNDDGGAGLAIEQLGLGDYFE